MGSRGPLPDPSSGRGRQRDRRLKAAGGTVSVVPASVSVSPPLPADPPAPADLGEAGRAAWRVAWRARWVQVSDGPMVVLFAELVDERQAMRAEIARDGAVLAKPVVSPRGEVLGEERYCHPLLKELRRLDAQILSLMRSLGLAPAARARLGVQVVEIERGASELERLRIMRGSRRPPDEENNGPS